MIFPKACRNTAIVNLLSQVDMDTIREASLFPSHFPEPWASDWGEDRQGIFMAFTYKGVQQRFRWIAPGKFLMGSPEDEKERYDDEIQHEVVLTTGFWLAETACTQALWQAVMGNNPGRFNDTSDNPVENVSWNDTMEFIKKVNELKPELNLRLPTEAEWEYACRAGTSTPFSLGENITTEQVNYDGNYPYAGGKKGEYRGKTVPVKSFPCNAWGMYEMHGNVREWCSDWYGKYPTGTVIDPVGPGAGDYRVLRGGSWISLARLVRSACRYYGLPGHRGDRNGFRLARVQKGSILYY